MASRIMESAHARKRKCQLSAHAQRRSHMRTEMQTVVQVKQEPKLSEMKEKINGSTKDKWLDKSSLNSQVSKVKFH
jgi:hypothetical protein